jgi:antitoxin (DNA-binding transcriptional repressor) of toxin-antitoxin stability system
MRAVGSRERKYPLRECVRRVRVGELLPVTERGEVVAELRQRVEPAIETEP